MYDAADPRLNAFLRLPVADVIIPVPPRDFVVGDLACFRTPLLSTYQTPAAEAEKASHIRWFSPTATGKVDKCLQFVDEHDGKVVFTSACETSVFAQLSPMAANATTSASVVIRAPGHIALEDTPKFVTNIDEREFVFPVVLKRQSNSTGSNVHG